MKCVVGSEECKEVGEGVVVESVRVQVEVGGEQVLNGHVGGA